MPADKVMRNVINELKKHPGVVCIIETLRENTPPFGLTTAYCCVVLEGTHSICGKFSQPGWNNSSLERKAREKAVIATMKFLWGDKALDKLFDLVLSGD